MNRNHYSHLLVVINFLFIMKLGAQEDLNLSIINDLQRKEIITQKGRDVLYKELKKYTVVKRSSLLNYLSEIYGREYLERLNMFDVISGLSKGEKVDPNLLQADSAMNIEVNIKADEALKDLKLEGISIYPPFIQGLDIEESNLVPTNQSVIGKNLISLSEKLLKLDLIDRKVMDDFLGRIPDKLVPENIMLSFYALYLEELEKQPQVNKNIGRVFQEWKKNYLIPEEAILDFDRVGELFDILQYSSKAEIIFLDELPQRAEDGYRIIYRKISDLIKEEIELKEFVLNVIDEDDSKSKRIDAQILITHNGTIYKDTIYYGYAGGRTSIEEGIKTKFTTRLINIVNAILVDNNRCERLYYINAGDYGYSKDKIGLMVLTRREYITVRKAKNIYFLMGPHPESVLNECTTKEIIDDAIRLGLINDRLSDEKIKSGLSLVSTILVESKLGFPAVYNIDDVDNLEILKLFQTASNGKVSFEKVKVDMVSSEELMLNFSYKNEDFEILLDPEKKLDYKLIQYLSTILHFEDGASQFYNIGNNAIDLGTFFLNAEQKEWIERNGESIWIGKFYSKPRKE